MILSRNLILSLEILTAHKLRTALSVTGIIVGVGAFVLMVSAGKGAEKRILDLIRGMGDNLLVVNAGQTRIFAGRQRQLETESTLVPSDAGAILEHCPSVQAVAPATGKRVSVRWLDENTNTTVLGMAREGFALRNISLASGRLFSAGEDRARRRMAVVGPTVVENLFADREPVGLTIRIGRVPFEVIGVTSPKGTDITGTDLDDIIFVPLETAMRRLLNVPYVETVYVQAVSAAHLESAEREIAELLRQRHRLRQGRPDDFTIRNQGALLETERETARSMTLLIGSVAGISLLVGGVGILAVMLIAVRERTMEIGLRRAVGATRRDILIQFLGESAVLGFAGGLAGVAGGIITALAISSSGFWEVVISWPAVSLGFAFSFCVGVIFGIYPAARAAALEPVDALRAE